jgi:signal peptidase II
VQTRLQIDLLAAVGVFLLDQGSKRMVYSRLGDRCICWEPLFRIRRVIHLKEFYKRGSGRALLTLIWSATLALTLVLHGRGLWFQSQYAGLGVALALGGAAGNLLDILRWRYVVDFVDLGWWPVFNLADLGIVTGLALALWA